LAVFKVKRILWLVLSATVLVRWIKELSAAEGADLKRAVVIDGVERTYLVHRPKGYEAGKRYPVVLVFDGGGSNAKDWVSSAG
jgi:poly(3-hydroxybutyrate) depolymerase